MLCKDKKKRITLKELLKHPWITSGCEDVREMRENASSENMFKNFVLQMPHSVKIYDEIQKHTETGNTKPI